MYYSDSLAAIKCNEILLHVSTIILMQQIDSGVCRVVVVEIFLKIIIDVNIYI